jgi:hypothetical protein
MKILLLLFLVGVFAMVTVASLRRRREQRRAERAKALRYERLKKLRRPAPHVSANARGSAIVEPPTRHDAPLSRPPPSRAA